MKYVTVNIQIDARDGKSALDFLKEYVHRCEVDGEVENSSAHCTSHDPTIPYLYASVKELECSDLNDCTDGC